MSNTKNNSQLGQELILEIMDLTDEGAGIGRHKGHVVFVPGALPGERVRVSIQKEKKNFAQAALIAIEETSPHRLKPPCPYVTDCGGCPIQAMDYDAQLHFKEKQVKDALNRIGGFESVPMQPIIGMSFPYHYRNKALYPFGFEKGRVVLGFYRPNSHSVVPIEGCLLQNDDHSRIIRQVTQWANQYKIPVYNPKAHQGILRHLFIRTTQAGEHMVGLVVNATKLPESKVLVEGLIAAVGKVVSLQVNSQLSRGTTVLGKHYETIYGTDTVVDTIGPLKFQLAMPAFFQVNPEQTRVLYQKAIDACGLTGNEIVWDIYSGAGTISLNLALQSKHVFGNELNVHAVENAKHNASLNGIHNVTFIEGPAEVIIPKWLKANERPNVVVLDPPRKGAEPQVLEAILEMAPDRIVYVSCKPSTLARDLKQLASGGYSLVTVQPVDMFPHSAHVECVVGLRKMD